jgi:DNA-binding LacI/PurR family transcriptional regulator
MLERSSTDEYAPSGTLLSSPVDDRSEGGKMAQRRATILDIARELGISKSAVANVLSDTGRYSPETGELVRATASRMGYVSNRAARSLRSSRIGAIGLSIPAVARNVAFYMDFAFGVARGAEASRADLTLFAREPAPDRSFQVDGAVIIDAPPDEPLVASLLAAGVPVVTVGRYTGLGADRIAGVLNARHDQLQQAVLDELRRRGWTRPAMIAVDDALSSSWAVETRERYLTWCARNGVRPLIHEVGLDEAPSALADALTALIERDEADAIICGGQGYAAQSQLVLEDRGLVVCRDVALASFAGDRLTEIGNPRISAIDLAPSDYGAAAASLLGDLLDAPPQETVHRWFDGARVHFAES